VLRRQSLLGDALSHSALPGIVASFLILNLLVSGGWIAVSDVIWVQPLLLTLAAVVVGSGTALLTDSVQRLGHVEASAALGVVFTTLFALGLLMVRLFADRVDLDVDCVLFGQLELVVLDTIQLGPVELPRACVINSSLFAVNLVLMLVCYKELTLVTFDPQLAHSLGFRPRLILLLQTVVTALTLVTAFRSVGSILVIGLLVMPAATASLFTRRLSRLIALSLVLAVLAAPLGHVMAKTLPRLIFQPLGFNQVYDASTAGMMAVAAGLMFVMALAVAPETGGLARLWRRVDLWLQIASDDFLAALFRRDEGRPIDKPTNFRDACWQTLAIWRLRQRGLIHQSGGLWTLTETGRPAAAQVVQAHRLWEAYLEKHFELPSDHLHMPAHWVEHYLDEELRSRLLDELNSPASDPHGREIPT
jgi:manganese/zinc/iron transport system permease protein